MTYTITIQVETPDQAPPTPRVPVPGHDPARMVRAAVEQAARVAVAVTFVNGAAADVRSIEPQPYRRRA